MLSSAISLITLASVAAASYLPRAASPAYKLQAHVLAGNHSINGLYVQSFHTGAATNAVVLVSNKTEVPAGHLNNTYQEYELGSFPYTFDLLASPPSYPVGTVPAKDVPPAGYNVVGLDVGTHTPGFALVSRTLARPGTPFRGFAACAVDGIEPYFTVGPQVQLFWRNATAGVPGARCAEIELRAVAA